MNLILFEYNKKKNFFQTKSQTVGFDFKNYRVILMNYTIGTAQMPTTSDYHPKS